MNHGNGGIHGRQTSPIPPPNRQNNRLLHAMRIRTRANLRPHDGPVAIWSGASPLARCRRKTAPGSTCRIGLFGVLLRRLPAKFGGNEYA